jgi:hypothetical protein
VTVTRLVGVLVILGTIALGVVVLRSEQARIARRIQRIQGELVWVRRELWSTQLEIARHRSPSRIQEAVESAGLELAAPQATGADGASKRWVSAR